MNGLQEAGVIDLSLMPPDYQAVDRDPLLGILQTLVYNPYTISKTLNLYHFWEAFKSLTSSVALNISDSVNSLWQTSRTRHDPLVLDMDGDGIETVAVNGSVLFDYDGDGIKTGTGWVKADDALLVYDRDGNGTIDNGGELFGDQTLVNGVKAVDGFAALSGEDSNNDGVFNAQDNSFTAVRIWQDINQDGISQADELKTLIEAGIASINLSSTATNNQNFKNTRRVA